MTHAPRSAFIRYEDGPYRAVGHAYLYRMKDGHYEVDAFGSAGAPNRAGIPEVSAPTTVYDLGRTETGRWRLTDRDGHPVAVTKLRRHAIQQAAVYAAIRAVDILREGLT